METYTPRAHLDLYLTEISIELLGNKMYNINGKRQNKLINLFKALPENNENRSNTQKNENSNDFLCSLGYRSDFTDNEETTREFLSDQFNFILEDSNSSPNTNQELVKFLREYRGNQSQIIRDACDVDLKTEVEKFKLIQQLNEARERSFDDTEIISDKVDAINKYYERENSDLLKMSMDALRLLKYIINDPKNDAKKGEFIGFIHTMRTARDKNRKEKPSKPYTKPKICN